MAKTTYDICVLPGDGIGTEVTAAALPLLERLAHGAGFGFAFAEHPGGALHYKATGDALPDATFAAAGLGPARVERIVPSLEDVFIHSIERADAAAAAAGRTN